MSREASSSWYSGGTMVVLPYASVDEMIDYGRRNNADYLVVQRQEVKELRPQLEPLHRSGAGRPRSGSRFITPDRARTRN